MCAGRYEKQIGEMGAKNAKKSQWQRTLATAQ